MCPKCKHEQSLHHEIYDYDGKTLFGHHCVGPTDKGGECCCGYDGSPEGTYVQRPPMFMVRMGGGFTFMTQRELDDLREWLTENSSDEDEGRKIP